MEFRISVAGPDPCSSRINTRIQEAPSLRSHVTGPMPSVSTRDNYEKYISYIRSYLLCQLRIRRRPKSNDPGRCLSAGLDAEGDRASQGFDKGAGGTASCFDQQGSAFVADATRKDPIADATRKDPIAYTTRKDPIAYTTRKNPITYGARRAGCCRPVREPHCCQPTQIVDSPLIDFSGDRTDGFGGRKVYISSCEEWLSVTFHSPAIRWR
jgi:hypothetical protein